jgi:hypothetical protein
MARALDVINQKLGTTYRRIDDFLHDAELPFMFAGLEQWRLNTSGRQADVESNPALHNVTMVSVVHDKNARRLLVNRLKGKATHKRDLDYWETLVPDWAETVRAKLAANGIPFSVELLSSPEINLTGQPPLFERGQSPVSLFPVSGNQRGELGYLRSLGAVTLMLEVWPSVYRYYHRGPGEPVPADLVAGLMFGSPVNVGGNEYVRSPLMATPSYEAWQAAGMPE